jgi:succinate dehydrogenase / fumarate reductase membrane anchor subunit
MPHLRSKLKLAKGLGSAVSGTDHWFMQRLTALALIPLVMWFVVTIVRLCQADKTGREIILSSHYTTLMLIFMIGVGLYHGLLGVKVIIEDYVHSECYKTALIIIAYFTTFITATVGIVAIFSFHILTIIDFM